MRTLALKASFAVALASLSFSMNCAAASYELTVYSDDIPSSGEAELETLFSHARPRVSDAMHVRRVTQAQGELSYGLGQGWAVGLQVPAVVAGATRRIEGAAVELQYVAPHDSERGGYWGLRTELGRQSSVYEGEVETSIELNPLLGWRFDRLHLTFNPSLEVPLHGEAARVSFKPSAKLSWQLGGRSALGVEYYGDWGPATSWRPMSKRDETLYAVADAQLPFGRINVGVGRGLHPAGGSADRWVAKLGLQFDLD